MTPENSQYNPEQQAILFKRMEELFKSSDFVESLRLAIDDFNSGRCGPRKKYDSIKDFEAGNGISIDPDNLET